MYDKSTHLSDCVAPANAKSPFDKIGRHIACMCNYIASDRETVTCVFRVRQLHVVHVFTVTKSPTKHEVYVPVVAHVPVTGFTKFQLGNTHAVSL
jgi:hypothetical protein